jgi:hypothetical protein
MSPATPERMPELSPSAAPELRAYWDLVRRLANAPEEVDPDDVDRCCVAAAKSREQLHTDVRHALERRRLLIASGGVVDLKVSCDVAAEGYRLVRESAEKARQDAAGREAGARRAWCILRGRLEGARAAERRLRELIPAHLARELEARRGQVLAALEALEEGRRLGINTEHLEAGLHYSEEQWRSARERIW